MTTPRSWAQRSWYTGLRFSLNRAYRFENILRPARGVLVGHRQIERFVSTGLDQVTQRLFGAAHRDRRQAGDLVGDLARRGNALLGSLDEVCHQPELVRLFGRQHVAC